MHTSSTPTPHRLALCALSAALLLALAACSSWPFGSAASVAPPAQPAAPTPVAVHPAPPSLPVAAPAPPADPWPAARHTVRHEYHGVTVADDYEWLENAADPATKAWVASQNRFSRSWLDKLPGHAALRDRIGALMKSRSNAYYGLIERGGQVFAMKTDTRKQQPLLVALKSVDDLATEHAVFDPNAVAANGSLAIDYWVPSLDGKRVAISVSENGSEDGTLRVIDVASGAEVGERVPRVAYPTGGGSVAWNADGSGFYYTRYPAPGERAEADIHFFMQVWFHRIGTPVAKDTFETGKDFPRIAEVALESSPDGRATLAIVENGDGGDYALHLHNASGWHTLALEEDGIKAAHFGSDGALYLLSRANAPRGKILRLPLAGLGSRPVVWAQVPVLVPQSEGTIENYTLAGGRLFVSDLVGGPSRLRAVDVKTRRATDIALPEVSAVNELATVGKGGVVADVSSYLAPNQWLHVEPGKAPRRSALVQTSEASFADCEVVREFATSKDGTKIPLNIIRRKGTVLDGRNPVILYGYGGYGVSETPRFSTSRRVWLERGGIFIDANLRGGGEYGEAWHLAGNLTRKQTVFDDFIASAEYLIRKGYTTPERLGIMGGSNGGLLMGAALTQRPELFRAVVSDVGIYDMLRVELDPNGAFNTTEFGSVKDKAQFQALYAYSPLHKVADGTKYPAVLMATGDNDGRVNPAHSRKMIARLQAAQGANAASRPILLSTSATAGHGIGTAMDERIGQYADSYGFFIQALMLGAAQ